MCLFCVAFVNVYIVGNKNFHLLSHHSKKMTSIHYCTECLGKRRQVKEMQNKSNTLLNLKCFVDWSIHNCEFIISCFLI